MKRSVSILLTLLLAGCTASSYDFTHVEGDNRVYLDNRPVRIPPHQIDLYGCEDGQPLICRCTGRIADCICSCPLAL